MESTKRALKFGLNESKRSILIFWMVVFIVNTFALFITKYTDATMGISQGGKLDSYSLLGFNILPIVIYLMTYNYESYYKNFPIALSFSMIRKDFFKSMVFNNILVALLFGFIQASLMKIDPILVKFAGEKPIYDFKIFNIQTDSLLYIMIYFFIAFLLFSSIWNLIALLNYKIGARFWIGLVALTILSQAILKVDIISNLVLPGEWLNVRIDALKFTVFSAATILIYGIIYLIIISTNIKNKA